MIQDYANLLIDAGEYAGRNDIASLFPRFVGLAEAKLNRLLRVAAMQKVDTVSTILGDGDLPDDFLEVFQVVTPNGWSLNAWPINELTRRFGTNSGVARGYSIVGNQIQFRPTMTEDVTLLYYAKIPPLTPAEPTNWLLETAPDIYLYALVEEIAIWERDGEKASGAQQIKMQSINGLKLNDERMRWGNSQVVLGTITP